LYRDSQTFPTRRSSDLVGIQFQTYKVLPYAMLAADLNGDHRPEILVGYVEASGAAFFNDGTGKKYQAVPFGNGKGTIYGMAAGEDRKSTRLNSSHVEIS